MKINPDCRLLKLLMAARQEYVLRCIYPRPKIAPRYGTEATKFTINQLPGFSVIAFIPELTSCWIAKVLLAECLLLTPISQGCCLLPLLMPIFQFFGRQWAGDEVTLGYTGIVGQQEVPVMLVLNALSDDLHAELLRHLKTRAEDRLQPLIVAGVVGEAAVDLQFIERQIAQLRQR